MAILLKNGYFAQNEEMIIQDIKIEAGIIQEISQTIPSKAEDMVYDLSGYYISPGFIDVHVHLREPGGEHKETIQSGTRAAAKGGYTTICAMPNTNPVPSTVNRLTAIQKIIKEDALVKVYPYASITNDLKGEDLVDFDALTKAGCFQFTDDGVGVQTADAMYRAMQQAKRNDKAIVAHCEENSLIHDGCVHEGEVSKRLGVNGIPSICEATQIARDVLLSEATGCHYHVCHVSTKESVRVIRDAKRAGIHVTAEVTPHHLLLNEDDVLSKDTNFKMNPPLRSKEDQQALIEGLKDGTIDFIATDHAPHHVDEKALPIEKAPFGIVGLETAFGLLYHHLVLKGTCTLAQLVNYLAVKPAEVFQLKQGDLAVGKPADITVLDIDYNGSIDKNTFVSKGKNTPFDQQEISGKVIKTFVDGKIVFGEA